MSLTDEDALLRALQGAALPARSRARYRVDNLVHEDEAAAHFSGERTADDGQTPVAIRVLRPSFARAVGTEALREHAADMARFAALVDGAPATPFLLRLLEAGNLVLPGGSGSELPWVAQEHVHGGAEGDTLEVRVAHAVTGTGYAFDPPRVGRVVDCLARGLEELHAAGVVSRALTPRTVRCCGFGREELAKLGPPRPALGVALPPELYGETSYVAPELIADPSMVGPWSDVFALGAVVFFLLTGEPHILPEVARNVAAAARPRSIADCEALSPELGERDAAIRAIDEAVAWATAPRREERPLGARALAQTLLAWLLPDARRARTPTRRLEQVTAADRGPSSAAWRWAAAHRAGEGRIVRHVAWDADRRALAATDRGLGYYDGTGWRDVPAAGLPDPAGVRFVRRIAPGRWLVGGDAATFAVLATDGVREVVRGADPSVRFDLFSGDLDDLAVFVGVGEGGPPALYALAGRRWLKPLPLDGVAALGSIARVADDRWLLAGRTEGRAGFAAIYAPLGWEVTHIPTPPVRAFLRCAGQPERDVGLVAGADGTVVWYDGGGARVETIEGGVDLSAAAVDVAARGWVAGAGTLWTRDPPSGAWRRAWHDPSWTTPVVSMFADAGLVVAMTASGDVLEGRAT
jgi:hypothetical protein